MHLIEILTNDIEYYGLIIYNNSDIDYQSSIMYPLEGEKAAYSFFAGMVQW